MKQLFQKLLASSLSLAICSTLFVFPNTALAVQVVSNINLEQKYAEDRLGGLVNLNAENGGILVSDTLVEGQIWSENFGWIEMQPDTGGVTVTLENGKGVLGGTGYGDVFGWVQFGEYNGVGSGVYIDSEGYFHGTAWSELQGAIAFGDYMLGTTLFTEVGDKATTWAQTTWLPAIVPGSMEIGKKYAEDEHGGYLDLDPNTGGIVVTDTQVTGQMWSSTFGWIEMQPVGGGVTVSIVNNEAVLSGKAYGDLFGWIEFGPQINLEGGVIVDGEGYFQGTARSDNLGILAFGDAMIGTTSFTTADKKLISWAQSTWRPAVATVISNIIDEHRYAEDEQGGYLDLNNPLGGIKVSDTLVEGQILSENFGWIEMQPVGGGVTLSDTNGLGVLSGQAYGDQTGWIDFGAYNGVGSGVTIDADGYFQGTALSENWGVLAFGDSMLGATPFTSLAQKTINWAQTTWRPTLTSADLQITSITPYITPDLPVSTQYSIVADIDGNATWDGNFVFYEDSGRSTSNSYAYADNIGWLDFGVFRVTDTEIVQAQAGVERGTGVNKVYGCSFEGVNADAVPYDTNVTISGATGILSGYAWCDNLGYVDMNNVTIQADGTFTGLANLLYGDGTQSFIAFFDGSFTDADGIVHPITNMSSYYMAVNWPYVEDKNIWDNANSLQYIADDSSVTSAGAYLAVTNFKTNANLWRTLADWNNAGAGITITGIPLNTTAKFKIIAKDTDNRLIGTWGTEFSAFSGVNIPGSLQVSLPSDITKKSSLIFNGFNFSGITNAADTEYAIIVESDGDINSFTHSVDTSVDGIIQASSINSLINTVEVSAALKRQYLQADGTLSDSPTWNTKTNWETLSGLEIANLGVNTLIRFRVKARGSNMLETYFGPEVVLNTGVNAASAPLLTVVPTSSVTDSIILDSIEINGNPANTQYAIALQNTATDWINGIDSTTMQWLGSDVKYVSLAPDNTVSLVSNLDYTTTSNLWHTKIEWDHLVITGLPANTAVKVRALSRTSNSQILADNWSNVSGIVYTRSTSGTIALMPLAEIAVQDNLANYAINQANAKKLAIQVTSAENAIGTEYALFIDKDGDATSFNSGMYLEQTGAYSTVVNATDNISASTTLWATLAEWNTVEIDNLPINTPIRIKMKSRNVALLETAFTNTVTVYTRATIPEKSIVNNVPLARATDTDSIALTLVQDGLNPRVGGGIYTDSIGEVFAQDTLYQVKFVDKTDADSTYYIKKYDNGTDGDGVSLSGYIYFRLVETSTNEDSTWYTQKEFTNDVIAGADVDNLLPGHSYEISVRTKNGDGVVSVFGTTALKITSVASTVAVVITGDVAGNRYAEDKHGGYLDLNAENGGITLTETLVEGQIWSENFGWIEMQPEGEGVTISLSADGSGVLSGKAYNDILGYIDFGAYNGAGSGVTIDIDGYWHGVAWSSLAAEFAFGDYMLGTTIYTGLAEKATYWAKVDWTSSAVVAAASSYEAQNPDIVSSKLLNTWFNTNTITFSSADLNTDPKNIFQYQYLWDTSETVAIGDLDACTDGTTWNTGLLDTLTLLEGGNYLHVIVCNADSVISSAGITSYGPYNYDITAPVISLLESVDGEYVSSTNLTLLSIAYDLGGSDIKNIHYQVDSDTATAYETFMSYKVLNLTQGVHTVKTQVTDKAGNESAWSDTITITVDTVVPVMDAIIAKTSLGGSIITDASIYSDDKPYFSWTSTLGLSGLNGYSIALDATPNNVIDTMNETYEYSLFPLSQGAHTLNIKVQNKAGAWSAVEAFTYTVDTWTPTLTMSLIDGGSYGISNWTNITGTTADASVISSLEIQVKDASGNYWNGVVFDTPETWNAITVAASWTYVLDIADLSDGIYTTTVRAKDSSIVESGDFNTKTVIANISIDALAPSIATITPANNSNISISTRPVIQTEANAKVFVKVNGEASFHEYLADSSGKYVFTAAIPLTANPSIEFYVEDAAGNAIGAQTVNYNYKAQLLSVNPSSARINTDIVLSGANFGTGGGDVKFTDVNGDAIIVAVSSGNWADTAITVTVPVNAVSGNVIVVSNIIQESNPIYFTIINEPKSIVLVPSGDLSMNKGDLKVFAAYAKDGLNGTGNLVPGLTYTWSVSNANGSLSGTGSVISFTADNAGSTTISVSVDDSLSNTISSTSGLITIYDTVSSNNLACSTASNLRLDFTALTDTGLPQGIDDGATTATTNLLTSYGAAADMVKINDYVGTASTSVIVQSLDLYSGISALKSVYFDAYATQENDATISYEITFDGTNWQTVVPETTVNAVVAGTDLRVRATLSGTTPAILHWMSVKMSNAFDVEGPNAGSGDYVYAAANCKSGIFQLGILEELDSGILAAKVQGNYKIKGDLNTYVDPGPIGVYTGETDADLLRKYLKYVQ